MARCEQYIFTSESVSPGHPDKLCDQLSDLVVDHYLAADPEARTAIETLATTNRVIVAGEVRGPGFLQRDLEDKVRDAVRLIGYEQDGFHYQTFDFHNYLHQQSVDIALGVDAGVNKEEGAGDQGIMFGYACDETETLMPAPLFWAHRLLEALEYERQTHLKNILGPDAKSQVSVIYRNGKPVGVDTIVLSTQHHPDVSVADVSHAVMPILERTLPTGWFPDVSRIHINPTGRFVIGGPDGDTGLTGRKIIVDTYGGAAPHGGGAFSGKDPTKVDRSAAYMARYLAKNIVASGLATRCLLQVSYGIGLARPLSIYLDFFGTGRVPEAIIEKRIFNDFSLTPRYIREQLGLNAPIYQKTATFGHFGRTVSDDMRYFTWEKTDLIDYFRAIE
jgi:S-adenosylmethionine synthetase